MIYVSLSTIPTTTAPVLVLRILCRERHSRDLRRLLFELDERRPGEHQQHGHVPLRRTDNWIHRLHAEQHLHDHLRVYGHSDRPVLGVLVRYPSGERDVPTLARCGCRAVLLFPWLLTRFGLFQQRNEAERFRKIDAKRGGRGFV